MTLSTNNSKKLATPVIVLNSGGLDSLTCLHWALERYERVHSLSFNYGQRNSKEIEAAANLASRCPVASHTLLPAKVWPWVTSCTLLESSFANTEETKDSFIVPARNIVFLSIAASFAQTLGCHTLVFGPNARDPESDCSKQAIEAARVAINLSLNDTFEIECPVLDLSKTEMIAWLATKGPEVWDQVARSITCYKNDPRGCGTCPSCIKRAQAFQELHMDDPAKYGVFK